MNKQSKEMEELITDYEEVVYLYGAGEAKAEEVIKERVKLEQFINDNYISNSEVEEDYIKWVLAPSLKDYKGKIPFYKYKEKAEVIILKYQD